MKKIALVCVFLSSFALTGCLEELLASLCKRLASNDSIITVFQTQTPEVYEGRYFKVTYTRRDPVTNALSAYTVSECAGDFNFPNGFKKLVTDGYSFSTVLDQVGQDFFSDGNGGLDSEDIYTSRIEWFIDDQCSSASVGAITSPEISDLTWVNAAEGAELPEEFDAIEECKITGQGAIIGLSDSQPL